MSEITLIKIIKERYYGVVMNEVTNNLIYCQLDNWKELHPISRVNSDGTYRFFWMYEDDYEISHGDYLEVGK